MVFAPKAAPSPAQPDPRALRHARATGRGIYPDLLQMDLSAEMRTALMELRSSNTEGEFRSDRFEKAGRVAALCAHHGVVLSG